MYDDGRYDETDRTDTRHRRRYADDFSSFNLDGRPGGTQRAPLRPPRAIALTPSTQGFQTPYSEAGHRTASASTLTRRFSRADTVERRLRFVEQKYAMLKRSYAQQRRQLALTLQSKRRLAADLRRKEEEKKTGESEMIRTCKRAMEENAHKHARSMDANNARIRRLEAENQSAQNEIRQLKRQRLEVARPLNFSPLPANFGASPPQGADGGVSPRLSGIALARVSDDSGVDDDELPGEDDNVAGCRPAAIVQLLELGALGERPLADAPTNGLDYKYLIVHKHADLRLRGFDGVETRFTDLDGVQDALIGRCGAAHSAQILQLVYMRVGRRLVEFLERCAERGQRFAGVSLQILDFAQHSRFFDYLLEEILCKARVLQIRNVRGVGLTKAVRAMLSDPDSAVDYLTIQHFSDVCRRPISFPIGAVLGYLHHGTSGRRRVLEIFDESIALSGDLLQTMANQCEMDFKAAKKPSAYALRLKSREAGMRRGSTLRDKELRNELTGEWLRIRLLSAGPADDFRRAVLIERGRSSTVTLATVADDAVSDDEMNF